MANPSIHYIGSNIGTLADHAQCERVWNGIVRQHTGEYRPPPAYNFGVCNDHGKFFVGRGWDRDSSANGVDEDPENENLGSRALLVLVGPDDQITDVCKRAIGAWAKEAVEQHGMEWPLRGHMTYVSTSCPGPELMPVINEINAGEWLDTGVPTVPEEEDMTVFLVMDPGPTQGAWVKDGLLLWHKPRVNEVGPGRVVLMSRQEMDQVIADVNKQRAAVGV